MPFRDGDPVNECDRISNRVRDGDRDRELVRRFFTMIRK